MCFSIGASWLWGRCLCNGAEDVRSVVVILESVRKINSTNEALQYSFFDAQCAVLSDGEHAALLY